MILFMLSDKGLGSLEVSIIHFWMQNFNTNLQHLDKLLVSSSGTVYREKA